MDTSTDVSQNIIFVSYTCIVALGLTANALVLRAFWQKGSSEILHSQLCVANIIMLAAVTLSAPSAWMGRWLFGDKMCQVYGCQVFFAGFAGSMFTTAICIDTLVRLRSLSGRGMGPKLCAVVSILIWIYSAVFAVAPLLGWGRYSYEIDSTSCGIDLHTTSENNYSYLMVTHAVFVLVALVTALCLVKVAWMARTRPNDEHAASVKVSIGLFLVLGLCCVPFYLRVVTYLRGVQPIFQGFLATEFSHVTTKMYCLLQPLVILVFSGTFRKRVDIRDVKKEE